MLNQKGLHRLCEWGHDVIGKIKAPMLGKQNFFPCARTRRFCRITYLLFCIDCNYSFLVPINYLYNIILFSIESVLVECIVCRSTALYIVLLLFTTKYEYYIIFQRKLLSRRKEKTHKTKGWGEETSNVVVDAAAVVPDIDCHRLAHMIWAFAVFHRRNRSV